MQTTRDYIGFLVKFSSCMKFCKCYFYCRNFLGWMHINRNSSSVIFNSHGTIFIDSNLYFFTITGKCFINRIVNNFINKMMQTLFSGASYVHAWSFPNSFKTLQNLNLFSCILCFFGHFFCWNT